MSATQCPQAIGDTVFRDGRSEGEFRMGSNLDVRCQSMRSEDPSWRPEDT